MEQELLELHHEVNRAIIRCRGVYSAWAKEHHIGYHEMLVFYTIREYGYCTQKQVCDNYHLPRQTMHNIISGLREKGFLEMDKTIVRGREKAFVMTEKGRSYAAPFLESLGNIEIEAARRMGPERIRAMTELVMEYDKMLEEALQNENKAVRMTAADVRTETDELDIQKAEDGGQTP